MKKFLASMMLAGALFAPMAVMAEDAEATTEAAAPAVTLHTPLLVTDSGQGNSATLLAVMLRRAQGVTYESKPLATVADLEGMKTLVIGVGASTKGLGAAGLDANQEMERTKSLVEAAKAAEMPVVGFHIGGMPRRGELSDTFNEYVFRNSDVFVLYNGGDEDGFFTRLAENTTVRVIRVDRKPEIGTEIVKLIETTTQEAE